MNSKFYELKLKVNRDYKGSLTAFQKDTNCPFEIKRVFYITNVPDKNMVRGNHINAHTSMMLIALQGSCIIECNDDGVCEKYNIIANNNAIYIEKGVFRKLYNFSKDAIILCLCDNYYDATEYETYKKS